MTSYSNKLKNTDQVQIHSSTKFRPGKILLQDKQHWCDVTILCMCVHMWEAGAGMQREGGRGRECVHERERERVYGSIHEGKIYMAWVVLSPVLTKMQNEKHISNDRFRQQKYSFSYYSKKHTL